MTLPITPVQFQGFEPDRLWSLWDMINAQIFGLAGWLTGFVEMERDLFTRGQVRDDLVGQGLLQPDIPGLIFSEDEGSRTLQFLGICDQLIAQFQLGTVQHRVERFRVALRAQPFGIAEAYAQVRALREALQHDLGYRYFYYYPQEKVQSLLKVTTDWADTMASLQFAKPEIEAAVDCYAIGHNLASVFHLMRVMEIGVQKFGRLLGVRLTKRTANRLTDLTWHQILDALNPKLKGLSQKTAKAKAKYEKFSAIQSYLYAVKDAWRNPTMHPRKSGYSDLETLNLLTHVRSFMNELASVVKP